MSKLIFSLSADGDSPDYQCLDGRFILQLGGDLGGGTFTVYRRIPAFGSTAASTQAIENAAFTSVPVSREILVDRGAVVFGTLSGSTSPAVVGLMDV